MLDWMQDHFPYVAAMVTGVPAPKIGKSFFESVLLILITSVVSAAGVSYMTVSKLETKAEYSQEQFKAQVERRNKEIEQIRSQITADALRSQVQYEAVRIELQRLAIALERRDYRAKGDRQ